MSIEARFRIDRGKFSLDVDLQIPSSGVTAVFGPSGCGKTTLLRAIAGLERTPGGYLKVGDMLWQGPDLFLAPHHRSLGFVFQEPSLFPHLDVRRNIEYGLKRVEKKACKVPLERAVGLLKIGRLMDRRPHQLSGGEQQRVAIARALAVSPAMLLMDEPLASLDAQHKREILPYLESLHREMDIPVLYVSHSRDEVARLADHMVLLTDGRLKSAGAVGDLFSRLDLALAHDPDAETVIDAVVAAHDDRYGLTLFDSSAGRIAMVGETLPVGSPVRLRVLARDVSLTLDAPGRTSIRNILPGTIETLVEEDDARVTARLQVGDTVLLSCISRKSADELGLKTGSPVFAQVKSIAVSV